MDNSTLTLEESRAFAARILQKPKQECSALECVAARKALAAFKAGAAFRECRQIFWDELDAVQLEASR